MACGSLGGFLVQEGLHSDVVISLVSWRRKKEKRLEEK